MADVADRVCLNHPERTSTTRCTTCFKPLCDDCAISRHDCDFCSKECADAYEQSSGRIAEFSAKEKQERRRKRIAKLFKAIIILGIIGGAAWYGETRFQLSAKIQHLLSQVSGFLS